MAREPLLQRYYNLSCEMNERRQETVEKVASELRDGDSV